MSMSQEPLLSVIVPVYNVEPYLRTCVDSIVNQTYRRLEIILVDDGSTDASGAICDAYAAADPRVTVIHKPNGGQVSARKAGVSAAAGSYVAYVDADDWIDLNAYETMLGQSGDRQPDMVICSYAEEYQESSEVCHSTFPGGYYDTQRIRNEIYPSVFCNPFYSSRGIPPYLVIKLMRRELLEIGQMSVYDNVTFCEDDICTIHMLLLARSLAILDKPLYHYRKRPSSSVSDGFSLSQCQSTFENLNQIFSQYAKEDFFAEQLRSYMLYILLMKQYQLFFQKEFSHIPFGRLEIRRAALYGAGVFGREVYQKTQKYFPDRISLWVDQRYREYQARKLPVEPVEALLKTEYDVILVAVMDRTACETIRRNLTAMGIDSNKLRFAQLGPKDWRAAAQLLGEAATGTRKKEERQS